MKDWRQRARRVTRRAIRLSRDPKEVRRLIVLRCDHCGHRFRWMNDSRHSFGNRDGKVLHGPCIAYLIWRSKADERLTVLGLAIDVAGIGDRDVKLVAELRAETDAERVESSNRAFRVFYDLERAARTEGIA